MKTAQVILLLETMVLSGCKHVQTRPEEVPAKSITQTRVKSPNPNQAVPTTEPTCVENKICPEDSLAATNKIPQEPCVERSLPT